MYRKPPQSEDISHDVLIDAQNAENPHPTIMAGSALEKMEPGQILKLLTNNDSSYRNIRIYADSMGHELLRVQKLYEVTTFWIRKTGGGPSDPAE